MAADTPIIPALWAAGRFEASDPFNRVVDPAKFYVVEAIRTIPEMQGLKINVFSRVFEPAGYTQELYDAALPTLISQNAVVISLIPRVGAPVYVLSTHLLSFPLVDGVAYENMVLMVDMGPLPPDMAPALDQARQHFKDYVSANYGVDATVVLGTVPVIGYVSQVEYQAAEQTRKGKITDSTNDVSQIRKLEALIVTKDAYIKDLEARLGVTP